jgi:hypothetical protein
MIHPVRKVIIGIVYVLSIGLSFAGGIKYGLKLGWDLYTPILGMESYGQALSSQISLEKIDEGGIEEARKNLMLSLSGNIVVLEELIKNNDENAEMFKKVLIRIANHRPKYLEIYEKYIYGNDDLKAIFENEIKILEKYKK